MRIHEGGAVTRSDSASNPGPGQLAGRTLELLRELVRNACVNDLTPDSGQEVRNADTLEAFFDGVDVSITRLEPHPGRVSLVVQVPGTDPGADPLTLIGHTDVVPVDHDAWTRDPFAADIDHGAVWGRGVVDMLHLTAAMAVVTRAVAQGPRPAGTLTLVAAADEEARGGLGMAWIDRECPDLIPWDNCLGESGGSHLHGVDGTDSVVIAVGEKGAAQRRLHVQGDPGHASVPLGKDSAITLISKVAARLADAQLPVATDDTWSGFVRAFRFDAHLEAALVNGTYRGDFHEFADLAAYAHAVSRMTLACTVLGAGGPINVLPSSAHLDLDVRTLPGQDDEAVDAALVQALGDLAPRVRIERLICEDATASPLDTRLGRTLVEVLHEQHPHSRVVGTLFPGGTDLRFARRRGGIAYGFGSHATARTLGRVWAQMHAHDEHLHLEDLDLTVQALEAVVTRFLQVTDSGSRPGAGACAPEGHLTPS
ncbi:M20/M25/M40 family metallo-hydrolase [Schaalia sp. 19OD2882]|uniref:M20/M25/M40 family metallo-hydrolase n=1 Tax=Schaalia sp. 19OD2882 TaxID=2794089 RepID=UPI001C1ED5C5|nr:M20/M25/M40 family metallo-hydrolase [Schaalia sp. 19OD2882]QWW19055.1 M20/M25/M40 family metallo-hydrolase [Schaalia sp. 19OD2882]